MLGASAKPRKELSCSGYGFSYYTDMSEYKKPTINKVYLLASVAIIGFGLMTCVAGVFAIRSGQIILAQASRGSMTGEEALICGVSIMGMGGWAVRRVLQGKLR